MISNVREDMFLFRRNEIAIAVASIFLGIKGMNAESILSINFNSLKSVNPVGSFEAL